MTTHTPEQIEAATVAMFGAEAGKYPYWQRRMAQALTAAQVAQVGEKTKTQEAYEAGLEDGRAATQAQIEAILAEFEDELTVQQRRQAQVEAILAEFEDELTVQQRRFIADQINRLTAAAQVGPSPTQAQVAAATVAMFGAEAGKYSYWRERMAKALTAAAQVGEQGGPRLRAYELKVAKEIAAATIERCAQKAKQCFLERDPLGDEVAAAIRKLRDEP